MTPEAAEELRKPFPPETIGKLPRVTCKDCSDRSKTCSKHGKVKCATCGAFVSTAHIHLDYVGHAAVTDRLLQVDPEWTWEPYGFTPDGTPAVMVLGGETSLWIKLTIGGVTRPAVGTAASGAFELPKQLISDAIRNGAMRFGVALDLWSKEDLSHAEEESAADPVAVAELVEHLNAIVDEADRRKTKAAFVKEFGKPEQLPERALKAARDWVAERLAA